MTTEEVVQQLTAPDIEEQLNILRDMPHLSAVPEVYRILVANLASADSRVVFLSLDLLIKRYRSQLQEAADTFIPQFIHLLSTNDGPVVDRCIWALSVTGEKALHALITCIITATDERRKEACIWALGRNAHLRLQPKVVVDTLRTQLQEANPRIRYAAVNALMDMSPLRPFERLTSTEYDFEPLYGELQVVAQTLAETQPDYSEWMEQYLELLRDRKTYDG
ncbi:HEAT repeat domain-containing protein [Hymenobacter sp. GOD-10R]|uniref:HEAT repeat domain-containing protein n=1 Tax=Hymenobacter sp. GOD-10R TaxID=3093922 RepID=UPI002D7934EF|nr:HEAT repeat domain-containing protein [Hymenobacter sp. GOD-10R]WRQ31185.1 HEAT repeat domain-containing protein [Hymenobacter sp. GOD-10R]